MAKISNYIGYGLHLDRPAAGAPGALYFESDTGSGYRDNGTSWNLIVQPAPARPLTVVHTGVNTTLAAGHTLCVLTADFLTITAPDPALNTGLLISFAIPRGASHTVTLHRPDGSTIVSDNAVPYNFWSDGTDWLDGDF